MEKPIASQAGIGWQGKHTNLVSKDFGSWLLLGIILISEKLPYNIKQEDLCGNIYELPECEHTFHTNCIMHWFRTDHNTCPLCQNTGINYQNAFQQANSSGFAEKRLWENYYSEAFLFSSFSDLE